MPFALSVILAVFLFAVGLVLIIFGGDFLVNAAIWLADVTRIPQIVIGATLVSLCTTLPEVLVSTLGVIRGTPDGFSLAIGNAAGSMLFNMAVILGISLCVRRYIPEGKSFNEKAVFLMLATVLMVTFSATGQKIAGWEGLVLLLFFLSFMAFNVWDGLKTRKGLIAAGAPEPPGEDERIAANKAKKKWVMILKFIAGAAAIGVGSYLLVDNGLKLSGFAGISAQLMGVTFVAIGTSLPELITTITSLRKRTSSLGVGNIIGANIINSTLLLGLAGIVAWKSGLPLEFNTLTITFPLLIAVSLVLLLPILIKRRSYRAQGIIMLCIFSVYFVYNILHELAVIPF